MRETVDFDNNGLLLLPHDEKEANPRDYPVSWKNGQNT